MSKSKTSRGYDKIVELEPKHVALYKKGDKLKVYPPELPYANRKEYVVVQINPIKGILYLNEILKSD